MVYLDELLPQHPKIVRAGELIGGNNGQVVALGVFVTALCYARQHLTDGLIPQRCLGNVSRKSRAVSALIRVGLLKKTGAHDFQIHDYQEWNESAEAIKAERKKARERKRLERERRRLAKGGIVPKIPSDVTVVVTAVSQRDESPVTPLSHVPRSTTTIHDHDPRSEEKQPTAETAASPRPSSILDSPVFDRRAVRERLAKASNGNNYPILARIAREAITEGATYGELPREVEDRALEHQIAFTHETVVAACESEWFKHEHPDLVKS
jgi:hypothetical protein